jgi:protein arginine kinase activator
MIPESCKDCPKKKTVHLTQILDSGMKKYDVCEDCPVAANIQDPVSFKSLASFTGIKTPAAESGQTEGGSEKPTAPPREAGLTCPTCRFTEEHFNKNGRLGCPNCYDVFDEQIQKILPEMHRGTIHRGKIPAHLESSIQRENQLQELEQALQEAIRLENFEEAAKIRDSLRAMRAESSGKNS